MGLDHYKSNLFMKIVILSAYIILPISLFFYQLFNLREIETIPFIAQKLHNKNQCVDMFKLIRFRILTTLVLVTPLFFIHDEFYLYLFKGNIFCLILGFIIPVI